MAEPESEFVTFCREQLARTQVEPYGAQLRKDVLALCELFDSQNHSGGSAMVTRALLNDLLAWRTPNRFTKRPAPPGVGSTEGKG